MNNSISRFLLPVVLVVFAVVAAVAMVKLKPKAVKQKPPRPQPVVSVFTIEDGHKAVSVRGFGSVKAKRSVDIVPQVSGEVVEKSTVFEAGAHCTAGEVLLRIDDTDYALAAARAEADVAQAGLNLALAEEEAQVAREEWARHNGDTDQDPSALVLREPQLKLAGATLNAAKAALHQARVNLERCVIRAPFDGRILATNADQGQYLRSGNPIGTVYATDVAEITVQVADEDLAWIAVGNDARSDVAVNAEFAGKTHSWPGRAVRLGGAVDARSRLVPVVVEIQDAYQQQGDRPPLVDGLFAEVVFQGRAIDGSVIIPRTALRPGHKVWVVDADGKIAIRPVTVSRAGVDQAVISAGLAAGERVCTSNLQFVTDGLPVRVEGEPPAGKQAAGKQPETVKDGNS